MSSVTLVDRTPSVIVGVRLAKHEVTDEVAAFLVNECASNSRVDTGSYRDGWYQVGPLTDQYAEAVGAAQSDNPKVVIVEKQTPLIEGGAVVSNVVGHAQIVEEKLGDHTLLRASELTRAVFPRRVTNKIQAVLESGGLR